jgi:hypothetical protein
MRHRSVAVAAVLLLAAIVLAARAPTLHEETIARARVAGIGFPFGDDIAVKVAHLGVFRFRCESGERVVTRYLHPGSYQDGTVNPLGVSAVAFHTSRPWVAPAQRMGRQVWKITSRTEGATERTVVTLDYVVTPKSRVCYVKRSRIDARITPNSR